MVGCREEGALLQLLVGFWCCYVLAADYDICRWVRFWTRDIAGRSHLPSHSKQFVSRLAGLVDICLADQLFGIPSSVELFCAWNSERPLYCLA